MNGSPVQRRRTSKCAPTAAGIWQISRQLDELFTKLKEIVRLYSSFSPWDAIVHKRARSLSFAPTHSRPQSSSHTVKKAKGLESRMAPTVKGLQTWLLVNRNSKNRILTHSIVSLVFRTPFKVTYVCWWNWSPLKHF